MTDFYNAAKKIRPSVVFPSTDAANTSALTKRVELDQLRYSKYGSTIFIVEGNHSIKTLIHQRPL